MIYWIIGVVAVVYFLISIQMIRAIHGSCYERIKYFGVKHFLIELLLFPLMELIVFTLISIADE